MAPITAATFAHTLDTAVKQTAGYNLATYFDLTDSHARGLLDGLPMREQKTVELHEFSYGRTYSQRLKAGPWADMATAHTQVIVALEDKTADPITMKPRLNGDTITAAQKQHEVVNALYRWLMAEAKPTGWVLPVLYQVCRDLKRLSMSADGQKILRGEKVMQLEEASRLLQKCFSACLNDRHANNSVSRKMGTYYMATLLFKTYFKLRSTALCKNLIKGIGAADLAPLHTYPLSHQVAYTYYMGVFAFLREDYADAERQFLRALSLTHARGRRNIELILDYLIPILLLRGVLPSTRLLKRSERLAVLYIPFIEAYKSGDVRLYDRQLLAAEKRLMERGTYLVVERAREGAVRALLKKAWLLEDKPARLSVEKFQWYYARGAGIEIDKDEVECILANMIFKGLMKGYISHAHGLVVLSKENPFPSQKKGSEWLKQVAVR